jgi:predicted nuclease of predicted toxin-antitoxin system
LPFLTLLTRLLRQMRILLDENFPADFAGLLAGHEVLHVHSLGWAGVKNGELLRRASAICQIFVTLDRSLEFQKRKPTLVRQLQ